MTGATALGCSDPLPARPQRVLVHGGSGAGKSTLCRTVAARLGLPYQEIDALFHGPGWTPRPSFAEEAGELAAGPRWVVEYQYSAVRPLLLARADLFVWLDLPVRTVSWRLLRRTVRRRVRRTELWNGNIEPPLWTVLTDRDHILRWARRVRPLVGERADAALRREPPLTVVRLRSPAEVAHWSAGPLVDVTR